jgi:hypothetical protein
MDIDGVRMLPVYRIVTPVSFPGPFTFGSLELLLTAKVIQIWKLMFSDLCRLVTEET